MFQPPTITSKQTIKMIRSSFKQKFTYSRQRDSCDLDRLCDVQNMKLIGK